MKIFRLSFILLIFNLASLGVFSGQASALVYRPADNCTGIMRSADQLNYDPTYNRWPVVIQVSWSTSNPPRPISRLEVSRDAASPGQSDGTVEVRNCNPTASTYDTATSPQGNIRDLAAGPDTITYTAKATTDAGYTLSGSCVIRTDAAPTNPTPEGVDITCPPLSSKSSNPYNITCGVSFSSRTDKNQMRYYQVIRYASQSGANSASLSTFVVNTTPLPGGGGWTGSFSFSDTVNGYDIVTYR